MKKLTVIRADIVSAVAKKANIHENVENVRETVKDILEFVLSEMANALKNGKSVKMPKFGTFEVRKKTERLGRNPRNGVAAVISERQVVKFRASPFLKKKVNQKLTKK